MNSTENPNNPTTTPDCDDHARQAAIVDPFTGDERWVCQDCGADCGEVVR